jgi:hypothetical protein
VWTLQYILKNGFFCQVFPGFPQVRCEKPDILLSETWPDSYPNFWVLANFDTLHDTMCSITGMSSITGMCSMTGMCYHANTLAKEDPKGDPKEDPKEDPKGDPKGIYKVHKNCFIC